MNRAQLAETCRCGHYRGDHYQELGVSQGCLAIPPCNCAWYTPEAPTEGKPEGASGVCDRCAGTTIIEVEDQVLGGLVLDACPDCLGEGL